MHHAAPIALAILTPPAVEPVTLDELKAHLRVDHDQDDADIVRLAKAARDLIEEELSQSLTTRTYIADFEGFTSVEGGCRHHGDPSRWRNCGAAIRLPRPPLAAVAAVTYAGADGATQTLPPAAYRVRTGDPGLIEPAPGYAWPITDPRATFGLRVIYQAGFGPTPASVPERFRHAIIVTVAAWYDMEDPDTTALPAAARRIIDSEGRTYG